MRNTVFMLNMCYSGEYYEGDLKQALARGLDEMMIVKKWKPGATTEMKWKKLIEYIALSHFPHIQREQLKLSDEEFQGQVCKILFLHNKIVKNKGWPAEDRAESQRGGGAAVRVDDGPRVQVLVELWWSAGLLAAMACRL